jgi:menaquinone-dependent protoporphyrinogen oxidase
MTVLVATASRHGATEEIAAAIGQVLEGQGLAVNVKRMENVDTVLPYDACVLGSAVYVGTWLRGARAFIDEHAEALALRPTWLFSSGPIGSPPQRVASDSVDVRDLAEKTRARDHHVFSGKLEKSRLGLSERVLVGALHVPEGDYREWDAVSAWATVIARVLQSEVVVQHEAWLAQTRETAATT